MQRTGFGCLVLGLVSLLSAGCFQKIKQCNALIEVTNQQQTAAAGLMNPATAPSAELFAGLATSLEQGNTRVGAVALTDPQLVALRNEYRQGMERMARAVRETGTAMAANNNEGATAAARNIQPAAEATSGVLDRLNSYCQQR